MVWPVFIEWVQILRKLFMKMTFCTIIKYMVLTFDFYKLGIIIIINVLKIGKYPYDYRLDN